MASSEPTEWLSFSGAPEEKAAMFVQNLNRKAFAQGKSKDDEWLAQYAAACLSDDALTWYYSLAEEVQNSWRKMCPALLKEFSNKPGAAAKAAESDIIPAAAAAPPAPASPPPPPPAPAPGWNSSSARTPSPAARASRNPAERSSTTRIGYIEIVDALSGDRLGYINSKGDKTITQDVNDALLLELPLAASPSNPVPLRIVNSTGVDPERAFAGILTREPAGLVDPDILCTRK